MSSESYYRKELEQERDKVQELLAVCKYVVTMLDGGKHQGKIYSDTIHETDDDKTILDQLKEAIAKAEGYYPKAINTANMRRDK